MTSNNDVLYKLNIGKHDYPRYQKKNREDNRTIYVSQEHLTFFYVTPQPL